MFVVYLPFFLGGRDATEWPKFISNWQITAVKWVTAAAMVPILFSFTIATFPGENQDLQFARWWNPLHNWLFKLDHPYFGADTFLHLQTSIFSNRLLLSDFDALEASKIDDPKKLESVKHTLSLAGRHLEGAVFNRADLRKAELKEARLQGASLWEAQLQGASLDGAQLQGASLGGAQLQGASLQGAQLQGAYFYNSTLAGTSLADVAVWRTSFEGASLATVFENGLKKNIAISKDEFAALKSMIKREVPAGTKREDALKLIEELNPDIFGVESSQDLALEKGRADEAAYQKALADQLKSLVCSGDESAPYIVRGLTREEILVTGLPRKKIVVPFIVGPRISEAGPFALGLVESILAADCPVSATLTEQDKANLKKLAKEAKGRESKQ